MTVTTDRPDLLADRSPQCRGINTHRGCTQAYRGEAGAVVHCRCLCHYQEPASVDRRVVQLAWDDPGTGEDEWDDRDHVVAGVITAGVESPAPDPRPLRLAFSAPGPGSTVPPVDALAELRRDHEAELAIIVAERDALAQGYAEAQAELRNWKLRAQAHAGREFDVAVTHQRDHDDARRCWQEDHVAVIADLRAQLMTVTAPVVAPQPHTMTTDQLQPRG